MARLQETRCEPSPCSSGVEVSELAAAGEQGPTSKAKLKCHRMKCYENRRPEVPSLGPGFFAIYIPTHNPG